MQLAFELAFDTPMPDLCGSDPTRVRQIVVNLVGNAIKFTETGGVRIVAGMVKAGDGGDHLLKIDVIDTGVGMTEVQLAKLFRAFSQADTSTTRRFGGTGLGLAISRRLAQRLGGDIAVASTYGEGTTFTATVRCKVADDARWANRTVDNRQRQFQGVAGEAYHPSRGVADQYDSVAGARILVAEDGLDNQRLINTILEAAGATVVVADNGRVAFDAATKAVEAGHPFDVILMDMQMPVMDGYDATGALRSWGYRGPIIALTAHAMASDRRKCIEAGCTDFATKPIVFDKLIGMIRNLIPPRETASGAVSSAPLPATSHTQDTATATSVSTATATVDATDVNVIRSQYASMPAMKDLIAQYVDNACKQAEVIHAAVDGDDANTLRTLAHQLKGSGGGYGFMEITEAATKVEQALKRGDGIAAVRGDLDALLDVLSRIRA